jgi:hypothetical protein
LGIVDREGVERVGCDAEFHAWHQQNVEGMIRRQPGRKIGLHFADEPLANRFRLRPARQSVGDPSRGRVAGRDPLRDKSGDPDDMLGLGIGRELAARRPARPMDTI